MNERILELAEKSRCLTGWSIGRVELEEFAAAIIQECITIVESCGEQTEQDWDRAIRTASKKIKQQLGVES